MTRTRKGVWIPNPNPNPDRLAERNYKKRIEQAMKEQWKEMGMTSIVFTCYTRRDGKLAIDV